MDLKNSSYNMMNHQPGKLVCILFKPNIFEMEYIFLKESVTMLMINFTGLVNNLTARKNAC